MTDRDDLRAAVERVLRENGLTDRPDEYDSDIHSWRCRYPDIYGPCGCFAELANELHFLLAEHPATEPPSVPMMTEGQAASLTPVDGLSVADLRLPTSFREQEVTESPSDEAAMHIDPEPPGMTFRPFTDAEVAALDAQPPRWVTEPPSGCGTCGGAGLVPEAHDGGMHPVHCPEGCDLPPSDHECDTGNFDRTVCPEPCGRMHSYCDTCGERQDDCAHEPTSGGEVTAEELRNEPPVPKWADLFGAAPGINLTGEPSEVAADELAEVLLAARVTGCCVACPYGHGDNRDQAVEIAEAILVRHDVRRKP